MSADIVRDIILSLPDDHRVSVGQVRGLICDTDSCTPDEDELTCRMWEKICTENISPDP